MQRLGKGVGVLALAAVALILTSHRAQAFQGHPHPGPRPLQGVEPYGQKADLHDQMMRLIGQVELRLKKIDELIFDASTGEPMSDEVEESGIYKLVNQARASGRQVLDDIDKILELAKSHSHPSMGGS